MSIIQELVNEVASKQQECYDTYYVIGKSEAYLSIMKLLSILEQRGVKELTIDSLNHAITEFINVDEDCDEIIYITEALKNELDEKLKYMIESDKDEVDEDLDDIKLN